MIVVSLNPEKIMNHLYRAAKFLKPYTWHVVATLTMLLTLTGLNLLVPRIIQTVIDDGLLVGNTSYLVRSALLLFSLGIGSAILGLSNRYLSEWIASRVGYDLRNRMYDHIQYLPFTYHDHAQSGQLISRCIEDVRSIEKFAGSSIAEIVRFFFLTIGILIVMLSVNVKLAIIAILPMIPLILSSSIHRLSVLTTWPRNRLWVTCQSHFSALISSRLSSKAFKTFLTCPI